MSQDIVSDGLNQIMNAKMVEKRSLSISRHSKLLLNVFEMMKNLGHINYEINKETGNVDVKILKLNKCHSVKPRYYVKTDEIEKYLRRFLPSRNFGVLVISTNKGLISHIDAINQKIGGSIIAYFY